MSTVKAHADLQELIAKHGLEAVLVALHSYADVLNDEYAEDSIIRRHWVAIAVHVEVALETYQKLKNLPEYTTENL